MKLANGRLFGEAMGPVMAGRREKSLIMDLKTPRYFFASLDKLFIPPVSLWFRYLDWRETRT